MIYTQKTKLAQKLCYEKHQGQFDKSGVPYVFHPIHLAEQMEDEDTTIVALLHDIIEDTDCTAELLYEMGFSERVVEAIMLMTHKKGVDYMDYVREIAKNPIARAVKIADLKHNSDLTRLEAVDEKALKRREKYLNALEFLEK